MEALRAAAAVAEPERPAVTAELAAAVSLPGGTGGIGCCSAGGGGGGGAAKGGAIFNHGGTVNIGVCTFTGNSAEGGARGGNYFGGPAATMGGVTAQPFSTTTAP